MLIPRLLSVEANATSGLCAHGHDNSVERESVQAISPGNYKSVHKRMSGKTAHGNIYLRAVLYEVAWVIAYTKGTYLTAYYHHIARRDKK